MILILFSLPSVTKTPEFTVFGYLPSLLLIIHKCSNVSHIFLLLNRSCFRKETYAAMDRFPSDEIL